MIMYRDRMKYLSDHDYRVARLTELLLMGHRWSEVRRIMMMEKPEFDQLLDSARSRKRSRNKNRLRRDTWFAERAMTRTRRVRLGVGPAPDFLLRCHLISRS